MQIRFTNNFARHYQKSGVKIQSAFNDRLKQFIHNPSSPLLHNHALRGKLSGYRSINITGDWRGIYSTTQNQEGDTVIIFEMLGTHSQLYR